MKRSRSAYPCLLGISITSTQLLESRLLLLPQVRVLLLLGLIEAIDNRILPLLNMYALNLAQA